MKIFWRCYVCNDIHCGVNPPEICPTCGVKNAYLEVSSEEAMKASSPFKTVVNKKKYHGIIEDFTRKNEFRVNPDREKIEMLLEGMFDNEKNHGMKYCPCRLITKDFKEDLKLVCPCNFLIHETYKDKPDGECWCGLFVKRRSQ